MKERPILFSGSMVRAILEDRKTQTRRVESPRNAYEPGDRLWVRETWRWDGCGCPPDNIEYRADGCKEVPRYAGMPWRPSIHMPRWASRITLEVTGVRVEQVQAISEEDAQAEGLKRITKDGGITWKWGLPDRDGLPGADDDGMPWGDWSVDARLPFRKLWNAINGKRPGCSWDDNPRVRVVEFRRLEVTR